ncbi:MAG: hypothetical protein ACXVX0_10030 [Blastococcus sp.]
MTSRPLLRSLSIVTLVLAAGEFVSAVIIWREAYADSQPWFAVAFGLLFLAGVALLRAGRAVLGAAATGALCLFELITAPTWQRFSVLDWAFQLAYVAVSLCGLLLAVAVLVTHRRGSGAPAGEPATRRRAA